MAADQDSPPPESLELEVERAAALPPAERDAAIAALCAAHPDHAPEIRMMLMLRGLDASAAAPPPRASATPPPERIGPYKLERILGEGGMGTVWLASQEQPVRRRVAIKLVKAGMDSDRIVKRFEAERQALALMEHSSIARVFDGGLTEDGRPYFVMEFVDGEPINTFCRREEADLDTRLELIEQVCAGVAHAHQKGVIHRDLKPTNILVTRENGIPRAKIIDFGLARAIEGEQLANTMLTLHGQVIGTPAYMSPEQATLDTDHIDTRTDVYALGVVMYELCTGELPLRFDETKLDLAAIQRRICDEDPIRPSSKVAGRPHPAPPRPHWVRRLRGELDWIVMRALEKAPDRRYGSAAALGADIRRYLDDLPVEARPPSTFYQLTKFARRNRGLVAGAAIAALALVAGTVTSVAFALEAIADRNAAESAGKAFERARDDAEAIARFQSETLATINARQVGEVIATQLGKDLRASDLFDAEADAEARVERILDAINPSELARQALDQSLLHTAVEAIDEQFADRPLVAARLHASFGQAYENIGLPEGALERCRRALELRRAALGEDHHDTITSVGDLGTTLMQTGDYEHAAPLLERAYDARRAEVPPDTGLIAEAAQRLSRLYAGTKDYAKSEQMAREAVALFGQIGELRRRAMANSALADALRRQDRAAEALPVLEEALADARSVAGPEDDTAMMLAFNLAMMYRHTGQPQEAARQLAELLPIVDAVYGEHDPRTLRTIESYGLALRDAGDPAAAKAQFEESLRRLRQTRPADDPLVRRAAGMIESLEQQIGK
ncbi:MAG: serine/threonine protein kinase [Planctomycetes bacterium]|nr:serine/threonine protein kinase [Planctomycetota bacterium]